MSAVLCVTIIFVERVLQGMNMGVRVILWSQVQQKNKMFPIKLKTGERKDRR